MKVAIGALVCWLACVSQVAATSTPQSLVGIEAYDPLQHAHLVVRGRVLSVRTERILMADWGMADKGMESSMMTVTRIQVAVASVLKGETHEKEILFNAIGGLAPLFEANHEYIICARWRPLKDGGIYVTSPYVGLYRREGDAWARTVLESAIEKYETLSDAQIDARLQSGSLKSTAKFAEVIARGRVTKVWRTQYTADNGRVGEAVHYALEVHEVLLGDAPGGRIEFVVARVAEYTPNWYRVVPLEIQVGEEWYVFLKWGEKGLYPFAGPNSLLRVDGESLIYDNAVKYPRTVGEVNRVVHTEVGDGR